MDKKKGFLNVFVSIAFRILLLIANIFVRKYIIQCIGNEINGLNSLYISILDFLSVAELGVGSAITFCMYKPIVEGNHDKVSALYSLFKKLYLIIGGIILAGGFALMPALKFLAKDYAVVDVNLYLTFGLMLVSVVLSYAFSSKTSLINAYKNNFITTTISSAGILLQSGMQIAVLILTRSFVLFLACRIISMLLQWLLTEIVTRKKYSFIIRNKRRVDKATGREVTKNVKAMFMHRIGGVLVNTADSIIISAFIGVIILGKYSNYTTILIAMVSILTLFFTQLTSIIGHIFVEEGEETMKKYHKFFHTFNFVLGLLFFLGYYAIIDNLITVLFGPNLQLAKSVSFVITLNYFIQFMRNATLLFREATGTFYFDRWKPLVEGCINIALSILFVEIFPEEYNVVGVIVATIITNIFICHIVEPYVLYKHAFHSSPKPYYLHNYFYIALFAAALGVLNFAMVEIENEWLELLANGSISVGISLLIVAVVLLCDRNFLRHFKKLFSKFKRKTAGSLPENDKNPDTETESYETEDDRSANSLKNDSEEKTPDVSGKT